MSSSNGTTTPETAAETGPTPAPAVVPITDVAAWHARNGSYKREIITAVGELLLGAMAAGDEDEPERAEDFTRRCLGHPVARLAAEDDPLTSAGAISTALALAELIEEHSPEIGPATHTDPPSWTVTVMGEDRLRHPKHLRCFFPAGTLADCDSVVVLAWSHHSRPAINALTPPQHRDEARAILDRIADRAAELSPFRGRILRASAGGGLNLTVIDVPETATRSNIVVPQTVWDEIDLSIRAVRDDHELLRRHGLGVRRGVLLCGPPGVGKSAVSAVVARELHRDGFTVIYVEARAGTALLTDVVELAESWRSPVLLILEDVDLWCRDRSHSLGVGLSELLQAMDVDPAARVLTLASTNDPSVLDAAALRTGRFDAVLEVGYPGRAAAAQILAALLDGLPGGDAVDTAVVAAALPEKTSGSDIREIVRRAVLSREPISTASLLAEVGAGRYRPTVGTGGGAYL